MQEPKAGAQPVSAALLSCKAPAWLPAAQLGQPQGQAAWGIARPLGGGCCAVTDTAPSAWGW